MDEARVARIAHAVSEEGRDLAIEIEWKRRAKAIVGSPFVRRKSYVVVASWPARGSAASLPLGRFPFEANAPCTPAAEILYVHGSHVATLNRFIPAAFLHYSCCERLQGTHEAMHKGIEGSEYYLGIS